MHSDNAHLNNYFTQASGVCVEKTQKPFPPISTPISQEFIGGVFMASKLRQLQVKACQVSQVAVTQGNSYYKQLMEQNKKYVQHPPSVERCNELAKQLFFTRLASIPLRYEAFWKEIDGVKQILRKWQDVKVEDAGIAALFGLECYAWYCAGEIVGRGFTITGYYP